jgi:hypothetical protein
MNSGVLEVAVYQELTVIEYSNFCLLKWCFTTLLLRFLATKDDKIHNYRENLKLSFNMSQVSDVTHGPLV